MLSRFTPASRNPAKYTSSTLFGLASSVTSASAATANASRQARTNRPTNSAGSSDGVPPPKKIVPASRPPSARPCVATSRSSAAT
jgi:hypothetical protein